MLLSCCGARQMLCLTKQEQHLADRCHSLPSLSPPLAAVGSLPKFELAHQLNQLSANKKSAIPDGMADFLELLARFELATSSLPRMRSTG